MIDWSFRVGDLVLLGGIVASQIVGYVRLQLAVKAAHDKAKEAQTTAAALAAKLEIAATNLNNFKIRSPRNTPLGTRSRLWKRVSSTRSRT